MLNEAVSQFITTRLKYLAMGTGSTDVTLLTEDVANPVTIDSTRNLLADTTTVTDNFFRVLFRVTSTMPVTQPVDYQQIGVHDGAADTSDIYWAHTLPVAITKDSNSQHDIIVSGRIFELETITV
jgi:hypothetical protein